MEDGHECIRHIRAFILTAEALMQRTTACLGFALVLAVPILAATAAAQTPATGMRKAAPPDSEQIGAAIFALPVQYRAGARVLGYHGTSTSLTMLRRGTGPYTCLASDPSKEFHVACYHQSLEPFMARGRQLRAQGVKDNMVDTVRLAEVRSGKVPMPTAPTAMYQLFGGRYDPATRTVTGAHPLFMLYMRGATAASTGLPDKPIDGGPWIMYPGTPKAHIMLSPKP
jgi:hypothetical protein